MENSSSDQEIISSLLPRLRSLRQHLHQFPELSGQEYKTAAILTSFIREYNPAKILNNLGSGTGMVAYWDSRKPGPFILFRTEIDALPIDEEGDFSYRSKHAGVSHKCGHDGHATIVAGMAAVINKNPPLTGKVGLLFQPAEETGQGALAMVKDERFRQLKPDFIFGLHNLPGYPLGQIVLRSGTFCAASTGMRIILEGRTSHAAEPEKAISPMGCMINLLQNLPGLSNQLQTNQPTKLTVTHARLGKPSFGITPGTAILQITLRAYDTNDFDALIKKTETLANEEAQKSGLKIHFEFEETFPLTANSEEMINLVQTASEKAGLNFVKKDEPFPWSEDFGHYATIAQTAFFGLGAGEEVPNLHHPKYDFPDALIVYGISIFKSLMAIMNEKAKLAI